MAPEKETQREKKSSFIGDWDRIKSTCLRGRKAIKTIIIRGTKRGRRSPLLLSEKKNRQRGEG